MNDSFHTISETPFGKKLIVFDLDGTLTESKSDMDKEMAALFEKLLEKYQVAVIGGGQFELFQRQLLSKLDIRDELLKKLFLFPTTSTVFYKYEDGKWNQVYAHYLSEEDKKKIFEAFKKAFAETGYSHPEKIYGEVIEDRGSQVTFSALGQKAPLELKDKWKKEHSDIKMKIAELVQQYLPEMYVGAAGYTSIDVTQKGIDKEYGLNQIREQLKVDFNDMLFVGDALFSGGNDFAALRTGVFCISVKNIGETKELIKKLISL